MPICLLFRTKRWLGILVGIACAWIMALTSAPVQANAIPGAIAPGNPGSEESTIQSKVLLDVHPGKIQGTLLVELTPRPNTTFDLGVDFGGNLEAKDPYDVDVSLLTFGRTFRIGEKSALPFSGLGELNGEIQVGKNTYRLGRGRIGTLLAGGELPGYPAISYGLAGERFGYTKVLGDLSTKETYRRLGVHYLTYQLTPRLALGVGEAYVRTQNFGGDLYYDVLPLLPYYLAKYFPGVASSADNNIVYVDAEYEAPSWTGYGEVLINEFPAVPGVSKNPALYGLLAGVERGPWTFEYARLSNYAYSNGNKEGAAYAYQGRSLGHWLQSDGDTFDLRWKGSGEPLKFELGVFYRREGEGQVDDWWDSLEEARDNAFLSGVVQKTLGLFAGAKYQATGWSAKAEMQAGPTWNDDHRQGERGFYYTFHFGVALDAW